MYALDIVVQMHTAEFAKSKSGKGMYQVVDDLSVLYRNYFTGVNPWKKSFIWDVYSAIPWNRVGCASFKPVSEYLCPCNPT